MTRSQQDLARISDAAAMWVLRLKHDDSQKTRAEFDKWLRQGGPAYLDEFWLAQMMWEGLDGLDASFRRGLAASNDTVVEFPRALAAAADEEAPASNASIASVAASDEARLGASAKRRWLFALAATILVVIGAVAVGVGNLPFGAKTYATAIGGQEAVKMKDGSIIHLNTHSRVEVRFTDALREVRLIEGEALFTVAHDASRPFIVVTDNARVRAVGTQFNVYRRGSDATRVSVLEGVVQVTPSTALTPESSSPARLAAGDEAQIEGQHVTKAQTPDVQRAVAWRARRLVFAGDRLDYIASEFNRYNRIQIRVEGAVRERRMGGTFDADDPMPMVRYLSRDPDIEVMQKEGEIVIRPSAP